MATLRKLERQHEREKQRDETAAKAQFAELEQVVELLKSYLTINFRDSIQKMNRLRILLRKEIH